MQKPLIHPATDLIITQMIRDLPGSLLITGETGVGLYTIATYIGHSIGATLLTVLPEKDEKVNRESGTINVDSIRRLYTQTRTIQTSKLLIVIDYAERMGHQAQNAFLKLLEEPRDGIYFILATHMPGSLLPTIRSRTQRIDVKPITAKQTAELLDTLQVPEGRTRTQLLYMAEGLPAELTRLVGDNEYFESRVAVVRDARALLSGTAYEKLRVAHRYADSREKTLLLIHDALQIIRRSIQQKPDIQLIKQIDGLLDTYTKIKANGNIRLNLARLVL